MFGLIADLIASCTTILLPAYLSYKSIRSGDPGQTTPWLIYFIILALALLFESWTVFIIGWFPFYSWIRLFFLLYLVLPQTQGAKYLYLTYLEPYIVDHERSIDQFIGDAHNKLESMGLSYLTVVVDYIREKVLGQASPQQSAQQSGSNAAGTGYGGAVGNYASDLLSRFAMLQARTHAAASGGLSSLLSTAFAQAPASPGSSGATSRSTEAHAPFDLSAIQSFLANPSTSSADKSRLIQNNRDRLSTLLKALDKEQQTLDLAYGSGPGGLGSKSKSEQSFEQVSYDEVRTAPGLGYGPQVSSSSSTSRHSSGRGERTSSGGWTSGWFGGSSANEQASARTRRDPNDDDNDDDPGSQGWSAARDVTEAILSSGSDRNRDGHRR